MIVTSAEAASACGVPDDAGLQRVWSSAERFVRSYCWRDFDAKQRTEFLHGSWMHYVTLQESPIHSIDELRIDLSGYFDDSSLVSAADLASYYWTEDRYLFRRWPFEYALRSMKVLYTAGFYPVDDPDPTHAEFLMPADLRECVIQIIGNQLERGTGEVFASTSIGGISQNRFAEGLDPVILATLGNFRRWL